MSDSVLHRSQELCKLTMEFVKVAGTATIIHQTSPVKKAFPFPLTRLLTSLPSSSATYRLNSVLITRKTLWLIINLNSWLFHPGITILSSRRRFRKNSLFSSTFFGLPSGAVVLVFCLLACALRTAAFCSAIALRIRLIRATKRERYSAREMLVRFFRYRLVRSAMAFLTVDSVMMGRSLEGPAMIPRFKQPSEVLLTVQAR